MCNRFFDDQHHYWLEFDENRCLKLSRHNVDFIRAILRIDSNYKNSFDVNDESSARYYIVHHAEGYVQNEEIIHEICRRIDKENSTHLSVSGNNPGDNTGITIMARYISGIEDLHEQLNRGDSELVSQIANCVHGQNKFSFATKFCANMCRNLFTNAVADNYVLYDKVIAQILPYYAWKYANRVYVRRYRRNGTEYYSSCIETEFKTERRYQEYRELIDVILNNAVTENGNERLSREEFDTMLWYYYKGSGEEIKTALRTTYQHIHPNLH